MSAFETGYNIATMGETKENNRKKLQQEAAQSAASIGKDVSTMNKTDQETEKLKLQNRKQGFEIRMMQNKTVADDINYAIDDYVQTGDTEIMNMKIKNNPYLAQKLQKNYNISGIDNFDFVNNKNHQQLAKKYLNLDDKMLEEMLTMEPDVINDFKKGFVVARGANGDHLASIQEFTEQTGYISKASSSKAKALEDMLSKVKNIGKQMTLNEKKGELAQQYFDNPENKDKTWDDFEKEGLGETEKLSEMSAKEVKRLMQEEGLTYSKAVSRVKTAEKGKSIAGTEVAGGTSSVGSSGGSTSSKPTAAGLKSEYINLQVKKDSNSLTTEEESRFNVLEKLHSSEGDETRKQLTRGLNIVQRYRGSLFDSSNKITNQDISDASMYMDASKKKPNAKANAEFKEQFNTVKMGRKLASDVNSIGDEELAKGMVDTGIQEFKKLLSDTGFGKLSKEQQDKAITSVKTNTKLGMFLAKYIKSISGTAVAQSEFDRLTNLFSGSNFNNIQTIKAGINEFVNNLDQSFQDTAKTSLNDNPMTTLDLVKRWRELPKISNSSSKTKEAVKEEPIVEEKPKAVKQVVYQGKTYDVDETGNMTEVTN